jgi:putative ABC transport system permease protein
MRTLIREVRYAIRTALRARSVTALAVLAFALGIGVTSAVFSIFNSVLLAPLPYPDPDALVMVFDTQPACDTCPASFPKYHDWKSRNHVFAAIGGSTEASFVLTGRGDPEQVRGVYTTASLIDVFRIQPILGRWYTEQDDQPGAGKVVVLAYTFWSRRFNHDPSVLGTRVIFDGEPYQVIGVMPDGFAHRNADFFVPLARPLDPGTRGNHFLSTYGRLEKGVTLERATTDMRALGRTLAVEFGHNHGIDVRSYYEILVGNIRTALQVLLGAVFLVLLIACANVANLLLAAGLARRRELAIRLALGASYRDIARQLTCEALVLSFAGGALGLLLATWIVRIFLVLASNLLPRASTVHIDGRVLAFTAGVSVLVGVLCGLWPVVRLRVRALTSAIRDADTRTASGRASFGNGIVVAEIALAFALLVGAGLLLKNLMLLEQRDAGVQTSRIVAFDVAVSGNRYKADEQQAAFYREAVDRLRAVGGVEAVGGTSHLPMYRFGWNGEMSIEGGNPWSPRDAPLVENRWIVGDYFKTMGIPLVQGRLFDQRDRKGNTQVVVINRAMADKFWPGRDPVGRRVAPGSSDDWWQVIGVVGNVRSFGLASRIPYEMYRTVDQQPFASMTIVARTTSADPDTIVGSARQIIRTIDPLLPVTNVQTMEKVVSASVGQPRLLSALTALFGGLAGLLAMVGVYGVTSYNVRRQRREYGIRLALGADPGAVQRLIVGRGALVAAVGVAIGAVAAALLTRTLTTMLNDVKPSDPTVFVVNAAMVLLVSIAACYIPARWAGRVDPVEVLRDI